MKQLNYQIVLDDILQQILLGVTTAQPFEDAYRILEELIKENSTREQAYARCIRAMAEDAVIHIEDIDEKTALMTVIEKILKLNADSDFDSYVLFMEWKREPEKQFYRPRRHVLFRLVCDMQDLVDDKLDFLAVSMPPRTGKSTIGIFFLTFIMGREPLKANVMSGHSDKLTKGFHMEALSLIMDGMYRFKEVFPQSKLVDKSMSEETICLKQKSRFPTLTCRSIEGTLTGAVEVGRGALLYCDDLVADREQALSADRMDKLYQAYLNQLKDRMNDGAKQLMVATRWVPNDPIGRIQEQYEGNPRYRFTVLPALNEDGETNFDYLYGLGFSTEYYQDMKQSLVEAGEEDSWAAKYMGDPYYIGGLMFPAEELNYYTELPEGDPDAIIAVCDTKDRGVDYAVLPIGKVYGKNHYIDYVVCDNGLPEVVEPRIASALVTQKVDAARFESNAAGGRVADSIAEKCKELGHEVDVRKKYSTENKETRILVDSAWVKHNCYFLTEEKRNPDYRRFMNQLTHYTTEGKNKHDDAPDAMSMYKRFAASMKTATITPMQRPW